MSGWKSCDNCIYIKCCHGDKVYCTSNDAYRWWVPIRNLYNRNVEKTAMYEALIGLSPEPPKEET